MTILGKAYLVIGAATSIGTLFVSGRRTLSSAITTVLFGVAWPVALGSTFVLWLHVRTHERRGCPCKACEGFRK